VELSFEDSVERSILLGGKRVVNKSRKIGKALLAGFWGTVAITFLMYGWPIIGFPRMDIMVALGGVFPLDISPYILGALIHFGIGISLALIYVFFFEPWLPGPGWLRGALFSLAPWLFAITLLGPSVKLANEFFRGREAVAANPCAVANPRAAVQMNPCSVGAGNPCALRRNPCAAANPCGGGRASSNGISPQAMSLVAHLLYGVVLGVAYKPSGT
jgi:hypothetical protein